VPRVGFFVATCFAALAIVGGAGGIFFEFRDHTNHFVGPAIELSVGITLIALALLAETHGRGHRIVVGLRNSLIALLAVAVVLVLLFIFIRPFH